MSDAQFISSQCVSLDGEEIDTSASDSPLGIAFAISTTTQDFQSARQLCRSKEQRDVASFHTQQELDLMIALLNEVADTSQVWIGLFDDSSNITVETSDTSRFSWVDGTTLDLGVTPGQFPWRSGEPNNFGGRESCVEYEPQHCINFFGFCNLFHLGCPP